jgi:Flp pilus assembly protein TadB
MGNENEGSALDRELIELLNELRVALPGVQVLFAFLLTIAFSPRFETLSSSERATYFIAVLATAGATVLLIAPSAQHRLRWRQHDKEQLLRSSNRMAIAGLLLLAIAVSTSVFLVTKLLYDMPAAGVVGALLAVTFLVFWYILPLSRQIRDHESG